MGKIKKSDLCAVSVGDFCRRAIQSLCACIETDALIYCKSENAEYLKNTLLKDCLQTALTSVLAVAKIHGVKIDIELQEIEE